MKTGTGNKVKKTKNNIHNEKGWLALNGLANRKRLRVYTLPFIVKVLTFAP